MTEIESRKQAHLDICLHEQVEHGATRLEEIHLAYTTFPELNLAQIDSSCSFLYRTIKAPVFISCMTGGSKNSLVLNSILAKTAESLGIPLGLGSIRILFEQQDLVSDFSLRKIAPSIPIVANLGAIQLRNIKYSKIFDMLQQLEVDAIVLHSNVAQELYQKNGEVDFTNVLSHIRTFIDKCPLPVIIKEVGYGITPRDASVLLGYGAYAIDFAGSGGTNWAKVEQLIIKKNSVEEKNSKSANFTNLLSDAVYQLGYPTAMLMLAYCDYPNIIASGGIRNALDIARCVVLGAKTVGIALPVITQAVLGQEELFSYLHTLILDFQKIMLLCGVSKIENMIQVPFWISSAMQHDFLSFSKALGFNIPTRVSKVMHD